MVTVGLIANLLLAGGARRASVRQGLVPRPDPEAAQPLRHRFVITQPMRRSTLKSCIAALISCNFQSGIGLLTIKGYAAHRHRSGEGQQNSSYPFDRKTSAAAFRLSFAILSCSSSTTCST